MLLVLLLLVLLILYLRGTFRSRVKYRIKDVSSIEEPHFLLAMIGVSGSLHTNGYLKGFWDEINRIYTVRLEAIRRAKQTIHFETFYMNPGSRADEFADAIVERSQAGVEVQLLVDSFGVHSMPKKYWQRLQAAGVNVRFFNKFTWKAPLTYNIRTHRKLLLIDGEVAFVGGMGISDHWDGMEEIGDKAPWLDVEVCFTGTIVAILDGFFMQHWLYTGGVTKLTAKVFNPALSSGATVIVTPSDSPSVGSSVYALFYTSILAAKERIWIASPYFLPDAYSRQALVKAKKKRSRCAYLNGRNT